MKGKLKALSLVVAIATASAGLASIPAAAASQKVTAALSPSSVDVGTTAHVTGTVTPAAPGKQIRLQRFYSNAWHPYKWKYLSANSTYDFGIRINGPGVFPFRVASPSGASRSVTLSVYTWLDLTKLPLIAASGIYCDSVRTINGTFFSHACDIDAQWNTVDYYLSEWNLKRGCTAFRGTVGLDDDNNPDSAKVNLDIADELDHSLYNHTFAIGQSAPVSINISDRLRLKLTTLGMDDTNHGEQWIGIGNPQIRCTWHA